MREFWVEHSRANDLTEMMLDSEAETISPQEASEVLSILPNIAGKDILELGAGIGFVTLRTFSPF